ncbi:glycosyltransferase [Candidatus Accumulibacter phosphatis]|uniref:Glycosyltransferase n=1 Tax=Candidatus Accumulibacter phosphatis TaxID=327160 RepID=A0ABX1TVJ2_9PROT|nr:glycosyltransferase family 4 protein [Candidatus Accumulibacter phosphatis]NMQ26770.1 glycosyltransferase [Candidatus Accumulibacter phosphatis]
MLGIVGTINPNKGQHVAIEAMRILIDRGVGVQLIIAGVSGDDTYFEKLREQVNQASLIGFVKFIGAVPDSVEFIDTLDLLLVPSFDEALPTVILEAFSLGVPVVASNVGGIPEMIEDGSSGFLFQAGDAEKLASCLAGVICDKRLLENIAKAANEVVRNKFNLNVSNAQIEYCINETLSQ